ncbi:MAG TPA: hypothetical protein VF079_02385 [Sphingomicrobium sp.]
MHSFHQSRVRIVFEVLCAYGIAASCVGAWQQLGATAFLAAGAVAALYGLVHAFDVIRPKAAVAAEPQVAPAATADQTDTVIRSWPLTPATVDEAESVAPRPAKAPRKKRKTAKVPQPVEELEVGALPADPQPAEIEPEHAPIAPLFEPEPYLRTPRTAFGRKAG